MITHPRHVPSWACELFPFSHLKKHLLPRGRWQLNSSRSLAKAAESRKPVEFGLVKAIAKVQAAPGVQIVDVAEPCVSAGMVKIKLEAASVCGTDLHIYNWDAWASSRIQPPRIIGHEFCGTIVELG